ncbi:MAG: CHAT domain-containing protein [Cyanobacteria bacterium P01_F01_bin.13]
MFCLLHRHYVLVLVTLLGPTLATTAQAQSITAADPATTVEQIESLYQINGGNLSGDSTTLFHNFDQFGLLTGESALFSNPVTVQNIISRVGGGDPSIIDGLLTANGNANLYLVNPAGVLFGENAQLDLSGSFSASTATGLTFGTELFDTLSTNEFSLFTGAPTGYVFGNENASAVINTGNLSVAPEQSLTLLGGQVINTGQLSAPNGELLVMAVPGENLVQLSQTGSILELALETLPDEFAQPASAFTISTVPALLTGAAALDMATDITVNPDGTVSLSGSSLQVPLDQGTTIVSGQLDANNSGNIGIFGDQIALVDAALDTSGTLDGGTILIGGDRLGAGSVPNATATVIDATSVVQADGQGNGNGGEIVAWGTNLLSVTGQLSTQGGIDGGNGGEIETSSLGLLDIGTTPDVSAVNGQGGLWLIDPDNIRIVEGADAIGISDINPFDTNDLNVPEATLGVDLIIEALTDGADVEVIASGDGNIILDAELDYHETGDNSLSLIAEGEIQILEDIFDSLNDIQGSPSLDNLALTLQANEDITITGEISTGSGALLLESQQGNIDISGNLITSSGNIELRAPQGAITVDTPIQTSEIRFTEPNSPIAIPQGGDVKINAGGAVITGNISTSSDVNGGNVEIESETAIRVGNIDTSNTNPPPPSDAEAAGDVTLRASGDIVFNWISTRGGEAIDGGNVEIESSEGKVRGIEALNIELPPSTIIAATIATNGGNEDGSISILHNGDSSETPFDIGDASINGTAGDITTGAVTLSDGEFGEPFEGDFELENIEILTAEEILPPMPTPMPTPTPTLPDIPEPQVDQDSEQRESRESRESTFVARSRTPVLRQRFENLEDRLTSEFVEHLQLSPGVSTEIVDLVSAQNRLLDVQQETGKRPALLYAIFGLDGATNEDGSVLTTVEPSAPLELMLITAEGDPIFMPLKVTRQEVLTMAQRLRRQVSTPSRADRKDTSYLRAAQTLYQWLIAPIQVHLDEQNIDTISFVTDAGLRSIPLAALHDGENFIIQNYSIGLMPSLSLTDLTYQDIRNVGALVAGTAEFANQSALPGVPVELDAISSKWSSKVLQDNDFSLDKLKSERQQSLYGIIHLATHGEFNVGNLSNSYLYLYNDRLRLDQLRTIGLHKPTVELLTLSACQTALGNRSAELGFAGFSVLAGAKTSVASLWNVSDEASAGLMIEFYRQLQQNQPIIKANALRQAQLSMIRGDISVEGNQLKGVTESRTLPAELTINGQRDFSHPYYWAAFSLVGSPW